MGESKNIFLAIGLSLIIMIGYDTFYLQPKYEAAQRAATEKRASQEIVAPTIDGVTTPSTDNPVATNDVMSTALSVNDALNKDPRVAIETPELSGSISLVGLRLDDLLLVNHFDVLDKETRKNIRLFKPKGSNEAYYARFGWSSAGGNKNVPSASTLWSADGTLLTPETPITFSWDNGKGLRYLTKVSVDTHFMFTLEQSIINNGTNDIAVAPYGLITRRTVPDTTQMAILHEGPIAVLGGELEEISYSDLEDDGDFKKGSVGGWMGITDKYWMSIMVPDQTAIVRETAFKRRGTETPRHDVSYIENTVIVPAGGTVSNSTHLFAGAKKVNLIDDYAEMYNIKMFDRTIDWGWLYWLTRPIFFGVDYLFVLTGNFGIAILLLTVAIKGLLFPIANKGYRSMSRMKKVGPKIKSLQARYKEDKPKLQQEMMALYKKEKINPLSGCLPMLVQIPVFFALYKVLFVTIDMRHQPFFGWIQDLSAPDPLTPVNLFGLLPFEPWSILAVGIWPILMGLTMWLQQKLNPQNMEAAQAKVMAMLPIIFTFILAGFPSGLVIYWTWNNILSIGQQWFIMRREGVAITD